MGRYQRIFLVFLVLGLFLTPQVWAARIQMGTDSLSGKTGDDHGIAVSLTVKEGDYEGANPSQNEKAEFVVDNPRDGDRCVTNPSSSDSTGKVTGTCYASKAGSVKVYAKSTDRGDQSESVTLDFSEPDSTDDKPKDDPAADETAPQDSPTAADEAKKAAAMKAYQQQMAQAQGQGGGQQTAGSALASQLGLTEDKNTGMGDGLGSGSVAGSSTSSENNPRSDLDLLNSLIYLAGGVIFIIAALYFIWWQMKEHQGRLEKKKNTSGGSEGDKKNLQTEEKTDTPVENEDKKAPDVQKTAATTPVAPAPIPPVVQNALPPEQKKADTSVATPSYDPSKEMKNESAPKLATPQPANPQPNNSQPPARPTLAQLRTSQAAAQQPPEPTTIQPAASQPANLQANNSKPDNQQPNAPQTTSSTSPNYSVDAIARRITEEIKKSNSA